MAREKILGGLSLDTRPQDQPPSTAPFAKNGVLDTKGVVQNEQGFNVDPAVVNGDIIGVIETDGPAVIFSVYNGNSNIGLYDRTRNNYEQILSDAPYPITDKLNFDREFYITGEFQRNSLNERVVVWTDKKNPPRCLTLDQAGGIDTAKDLLLFLQAGTPTVTTSITNGGILEKGAYFASIKLLKKDGSETGYLTTSTALVVSDGTSNPTTDKALVINISNVDTSYDQLQIAIIQRINGEYKAIALDPVEVIPHPMIITYTGENPSTPILLEEILVPNAVYSKVHTMGQLNDALYIADLEKEPEIDLQRYANLIKIRVKSELIDVIPPPEEHVTGKKKSLMHQEVYAIYVRYHKTSGTWTRSFHIPGNAPLAGDLLPATGAHKASLEAKVFQVEDTNRNVSFSSRTMDTGIWVNADEVYPTTDSFDSSTIGGENLKGFPVRHHRMPSLAFCKENLYAGEPEYGRTKLDILGLEVSNVIIPGELQDVIDGYEIMLAKRTLANSTVVGQSIFMVAGQPRDLRNTQRGFMSTGGNWHTDIRDDKGDTTLGPYNGASSVILTGRDWDSSASGTLVATAKPGLRFRMHSFDMLFNKPSVQPAYIAPQLKMRINNFNKDYPAGCVAEDGETEDHDRRPVVYICDYTKGVSPTVVNSAHRVRAIEGTRYLPNDVDTGTWNNIQQETCFAGQMKWIGADGATADNELPLSIPRSAVNLTWWQRDVQRPTHVETYLVNLMDIKANLYSQVHGQSLVASGQLVPLSSGTNSTIYPGDVFLCDYTFHTYGWFGGHNEEGDKADNPLVNGGYKVIHRFICEAVSNINLRYEMEGNIYSKWWPKTPVTSQKKDAGDYIYLMDRSKDPNQFGYSRDLNVLNDFGVYPIHNPYYTEATNMPFRIHRGGKMPRQGKKRSWRTFLPLDYYEAQKNMGRIVKILGKDDRLLIHHENALFLTQDKARLESGLLSVTLGSGDIFQFEPQEALSAKQGYAGTQHELAAVDTPWGYVFLDAKQGQVFVYKDGVKFINQGLNQFLRQYLRLEEDNPFIGNGVTIGYDPEYKRVMLTVKNLKLSAGISNFVPDYSPTPSFIASLVPNTSIVYKDGRFQKFLGVNATEFSCASNAIPTGTNGNVTIPENTPNDTEIANISAQFTDPGDVLTYTIMGGNTGTAFTLDLRTGALKVSNSTMLDYEVRTSFALVIRATDTAGQYVDITYTVNLTQVDEAPRVLNYEFEVLETSATGTNVGQVIAVEPEGAPMTYTLETVGVPFSVHAGTGMITTTGALDYETTKAYELLVKVSDGTLHSISRVLVKVLNSNEAPVGNDATVTVYKDTAKDGDIVHVISYNDADGDRLTLEWSNEASTSDKFSYDPTTKEIKIKDLAKLTPGSSYAIQFKVTDEEGLYDSFTIAVNISVTALIFTPHDYQCIGASCGVGYTLAPDSSHCYKFEDTCATPPVSGTPINTEARTHSSYSMYGTVVYNTGYTVGGAGGYTKLVSAFWKNIPENTTDGPLNRCGLWAVDTDGNGVDDPVNTPIGFTIPVNIPATKQYYVAIAGDNRCQIKVNGVTIVDQNISELITNHNTIEGSTHDAQVSFKFWHVYPVQLNAGQSHIELTGINAGGPGSFGAEIYDATLAQLSVLTSYSDFSDELPLAPKLIFSTKDLRGQQLQLGGTVAWTCPDTYSLVQHAEGETSCGGQEYTCRRIVTTATSNGFTKKWNTVGVTDGTGAQLALLNNQPGQTFMGQAVPYFPNELNSVDCGYVP